MKKTFFMLTLLLLLSLAISTPALAAGTLTAERTSCGMLIDATGIANADGVQFCALYDTDGRMLEIVEITDPAGLLVYCDINAVSRVSAFTVAENSLMPISAAAETTLPALDTPMHLHVWDEGRVTVPADCGKEGVMTYLCADPNCADPATGQRSEAIPALEHLWSPWRPQDGTTHLRVCANNNQHTETADHAWELITVLEEPTYTSEGWGEYRCTVCPVVRRMAIPKLEPKDFWFTYNAEENEFMLNWPKAESDSSTQYFVNNMPVDAAEWSRDTFICRLSDVFYDLTALTSTDLVIETGSWNDRTVLYTAADAIRVEDSAAGNFTLTGQTDGTYRVGSDLDMASMLLTATLYNEDGALLFTKTYVTPDLNIYPWDGSTLELTGMVFSISEDTESLIVSRTPTEALTEFTRPAAPVGGTVTTAEALREALTLGGKVTLGADIQLSSRTIYGGEPVVLDLNGHTLTCSRLRLSHGKELTIIGTKSGSTFSGELCPAYARAFTVLGGTYGNMDVQWISEVALEDAKLYSPESVGLSVYDCGVVGLTDTEITSDGHMGLSVNDGKSLTITGGTFISNAPPEGSFGMRYEAIFAENIQKVSLTDVEANSCSGSAVSLHAGNTATVSGGSFMTYAENSAASAIEINEFNTAEVFGSPDGSSDPADVVVFSNTSGLVIEDTPYVTVSDLTANDHPDAPCGDYGVWVENGTTADLTRITTNCGQDGAVRVFYFDTATVSDLDLKGNSSGLPSGALSMDGIGSATVCDMASFGYYYGLYLQNCTEADLSDLDLEGTTFSLLCRDISSLTATDCSMKGEASFYVAGDYVLSGCVIRGDLEANGDSDRYVHVYLTDGSYFTGTKCENETGFIY